MRKASKEQRAQGGTPPGWYVFRSGAHTLACGWRKIRVLSSGPTPTLSPEGERETRVYLRSLPPAVPAVEGERMLPPPSQAG